MPDTKTLDDSVPDSRSASPLPEGTQSDLSKSLLKEPGLLFPWPGQSPGGLAKQTDQLHPKYLTYLHF